MTNITEEMDTTESDVKKFTSFDLRTRIEQKDKRFTSKPVPQNYVTPGTIVSSDPGFMRGHGTFLSKDDQGNPSLVASLVGTVERVNKLITVRPTGGVYYGDVGDVVVGRITKVRQKRWNVDVNSRLDGILKLSSINLPSGEQRRRSAEDELAMREILKEGDVISAEIQAVHNDGALALHTRSVKYGKLGPGVLLKISSSLIKRRKNHILNLPCGACVILGNNGYIWISSLPNGRMPGTNMEEEDSEGGKPLLEEIKITKEERLVIARLKNCITAIAKLFLPVYDTSIMYAYEASTKYEVKELLNPDILKEVGELVRLQMSLEEL